MKNIIQDWYFLNVYLEWYHSGQVYALPSNELQSVVDLIVLLLWWLSYLKDLLVNTLPLVKSEVYLSFEFCPGKKLCSIQRVDLDPLFSGIILKKKEKNIPTIVMYPLAQSRGMVCAV